MIRAKWRICGFGSVDDNHRVEIVLTQFGDFDIPYKLLARAMDCDSHSFRKDVRIYHQNYPKIPQINIETALFFSDVCLSLLLAALATLKIFEFGN
jgi:hypothetical protein